MVLCTIPSAVLAAIAAAPDKRAAFLLGLQNLLRVHGIFDSDTTGGWWKTVETFGSHSAHE
jgi:hypothetical protein